MSYERSVSISKGGLWGNIIRLGPPLIATKADIDELVTALDAAFASLG
jgi:4-aminobutyrate aminotransferase-like enzyme